MKCQYCGGEYRGEVCPDCGTPAGMERPPHQTSPFSTGRSAAHGVLHEVPHSVSHKVLHDKDESHNKTGFFDEEDFSDEPELTGESPRPDSFHQTAQPPVQPYQDRPRRSKWKRAILFGASAVIALCVVLTVLAMFSEDSSIESNSYTISVSQELRNTVKQQMQSSAASALMSRDTEEDVDLGEISYQADEYVGTQVSFLAQVLYNPQQTEEGTYFSFRSVSTEEGASVLYGIAFWPGKAPDMQDLDYISLSGTVLGEYQYRDSYNYQDSVPALYLSELEQSSYGEIFAPARVSVPVSGAKKTYGNCTITLTSVEFADVETRFLVTIENSGEGHLQVPSYEMEVTQGTRRYQWQNNYETNDDMTLQDIPGGSTVEAVLTFPAMPENEDISIRIEALEEYEELPSFQFRVEVPKVSADSAQGDVLVSAKPEESSDGEAELYEVSGPEEEASDGTE